nr:Trigger factor like [Ipomoea batatas]
MNTMMDLYGSEAIETTSTKPNKYPLCYLKKALQFLVPLSLLILSSYNFHFSHALERKYMFLICNGILFFLAKTLTFTSSFTDLDYVKRLPTPTLGNQSPFHILFQQVPQQQQQEKEEIFSSSGHGGALKVEADDEKGGGGAGLVDALQTDDEEEEDNDMNINTEELNRRVEEFIRKMKEEIRIEAKQQHLIAV